MHRRAFVRCAAAGLAAAPLVGLSRLPYRTALIGCGWWGMNILRTALASGTIEVVGLCDVDQTHLRSALEEVDNLTGRRVHTYEFYRDLLQSEQPDIVVVATPDHWHALCAIDSIAAGAHVYLEKPVSHTIVEGQAIVAAARANGRVVQVGTHRRLSPHNISAMEFLRAGGAGTVGMVRAFVHYGGGAGTPVEDRPIPEGLNWDLWCGPAPYRAFNPRIHPRGFRQYLDYANGQLGDWGIHWLDQMLWWSEEPYPHTVFSTGGRHIRADGTEAPDTQVATFTFESFTATWEHRQYAANRAESSNIGCYFYGTRGTLHLGWLDGWSFYASDRNEPVIREAPQLDAPDNQNIRASWDDFIQAIGRGRRPASNIESGYRATSLCLLAMISLRTGRSLRWDGQTVVGDEEAAALMRRPYRAPWVYPEP